MNSAGYSGTPLPRKLGIRPGARLAVIDAPENFDDVLTPLPDGVVAAAPNDALVDVLVAFYTSADALRATFAERARRVAATYDGLIQGLFAQEGFEEMIERDVLEGQHRNPDLNTGWFTTAYFHRPDELAAELTEAGLTVEALLAIEGPSDAMRDADRWLADEVMRGRLLRAIRRIESEPSILGAGGHIMAVGRNS